MVRPAAAVGSADVGDDLLVFGGDEALAFAHLEVLGAAKAPDKLLTDRLLDTARHVEVEVGHALLHHGAHIRTELLAMFPADLRIAGIHGCLDKRQRIGILPHEPVETLFLERTALDETLQIMTGLLAESLFLRHCRLLFFVHCIHKCKDRHYFRNRQIFVPKTVLLLLF